METSEVKVTCVSICCRFVLEKKPRRIHSGVFCVLLPPQGFAFTGRDKTGFRPEFLPLTYLAKILSDIEEQGSVWCVCVCVYIPPGLATEAFGGLRPNVCILSACLIKMEQGRKAWLYLSNSSPCVPALNPFEEQENVDARFVEETALKQTLILLGFEEK